MRPNHLCNAFAFFDANRYSIEGRCYLKTAGKYYLV